MQLIPLGDYYLWYCEWCDSRNLTLWTAVTKSQVCCAACQKKFGTDEPVPAGRPGRHQHAVSALI